MAPTTIWFTGQAGSFLIAAIPPECLPVRELPSFFPSCRGKKSDKLPTSSSSRGSWRLPVAGCFIMAERENTLASRRPRAADGNSAWTPSDEPIQNLEDTAGIPVAVRCLRRQGGSSRWTYCRLERYCNSSVEPAKGSRPREIHCASESDAEPASALQNAGLAESGRRLRCFRV